MIQQDEALMSNSEASQDKQVQQSSPPSSRSVTYRFRNIGPIKQAEMELGDLTIIAGRNNTGKTYLVYMLYGFLKMLIPLSERVASLLSRSKSRANFPDLRQAVMQLLHERNSTIPISEEILHDQRIKVTNKLAKYFSSQVGSNVFSSKYGDFSDASIEILDVTSCPDVVDNTSIEYELSSGGSLAISLDNNQASITINQTGSRPQIAELDRVLRFGYISVLFRNLFPEPFILSAERFGISLFYRELDFTKNQLVDLLQKMGSVKQGDRYSPLFIIDRATSRYALPIKDNIDYTRSIPDLKREKSALQKSKLFDGVKNMMDGYYSNSGDEIRFISKARGRGRSFNIPLHLASSSARGLSDLYFFLRHMAKLNHLLIIDEPESHLDTANQILLARLLARIVRSGLKVLVTTHSDYLIKEINNLIMLSNDFEEKDTVLKKLKYAVDEALTPDSIRAYVAENGSLTRCEVDSLGIDMPVFDETIDRINDTSNELTSRLHQ